MSYSQKIVLTILGLLSIGALCFASGVGGYILGYDAGEKEGYQTGYEAGVQEGVGSGYTLRNPTYREMKRFLARDETDSNPYIDDEYVCSDFAADVNNNAEAEGIRCALVEIKFLNGYGHMLVAFNTVDRGLIFIEAQYDDEVEVIIGAAYSQSNNYQKPEYDDTITRYLIAW